MIKGKLQDFYFLSEHRCCSFGCLIFTVVKYSVYIAFSCTTVMVKTILKNYHFIWLNVFLVCLVKADCPKNPANTFQHRGKCLAQGNQNNNLLKQEGQMSDALPATVPGPIAIVPIRHFWFSSLLIKWHWKQPSCASSNSVTQCLNLFKGWNIKTTEIKNKNKSYEEKKKKDSLLKTT